MSGCFSLPTLTSDFSHRNILKYCPERREKWADEHEMNEGIRDLWNKSVKEKDEVFILGDLFFGKDIDFIVDYLDSLHGKKHLIYGNHDEQIRRNESYFRTVFKSIQEYKEIKDGKTKICLFHFGQRVWNKSHRGSWHLFGHSHGTLPPHGKSVDVGIDSPWVTGQIEHRPFHMDEIRAFMDKQKSIGFAGD